MKKTRVRKVGNSLGLTLPLEMIKALDLHDGDELALRISGETLVMERLDPVLLEQMEAYRNELQQFKNTLKALT